MDIGPLELIIILVIILLLFGSTRLPKLSRSVGESLREIREGFLGKDGPSKDEKSKPPPQDAKKSKPEFTEEKIEVRRTNKG